MNARANDKDEFRVAGVGIIAGEDETSADYTTLSSWGGFGDGASDGLFPNSRQNIQPEHTRIGAFLPQSFLDLDEDSSPSTFKTRHATTFARIPSDVVGSW